MPRRNRWENSSLPTALGYQTLTTMNLCANYHIPSAHALTITQIPQQPTTSEDITHVIRTTTRY